MTSISSVSYPSQFQSPLQRLQSTLASEVSAGTISSSDQSALSSALQDIDNALKSDASSSGSQRPSSSDMKSKIDSLIGSEVQSGKLTSDQATELKKVFSDTFSAGGPGAAGGSGSDAASTSTNTSTSASSSNGSSSSDTSDLLKEFLKLLQQSSSSTNGLHPAPWLSSTAAPLKLGHDRRAERLHRWRDGVPDATTVADGSCGAAAAIGVAAAAVPAISGLGGDRRK